MPNLLTVNVLIGERVYAQLAHYELGLSTHNLRIATLRYRTDIWNAICLYLLWLWQKKPVKCNVHNVLWRTVSCITVYLDDHSVLGGSPSRKSHNSTLLDLHAATVRTGMFLGSNECSGLKMVATKKVRQWTYKYSQKSVDSLMFRPRNDIYRTST